MFKNYGDINFFEYGVLIDDEHNENEYRVLYCRPFCETDDNGNDLYYFADCTVNITDSWIDKNAVMNYAGMTPETFDPVLFAVNCISYYGAENFASPYDGYTFTRAEICEKLKYYLIANDRLNIEW